MFKSLPLYIGLRYLLAKKDNRLISFTTLISMLGLTLGVLVVILVMSVFNGSQGVMRDRTLITVPHGDIYTNGAFTHWQEAAQTIQAQADVQAVSPYIKTEAMMSQQGYHQIAAIHAIDPDAQNQVSDIESSMLQGSMQSLVSGEQGIVLGRVLAANLRLHVGDSVNLIVPQLSANSRDLRLNMHRFTVVGIFSVQFNADLNLAYIHLDDSLGLLGLESVAEEVHLRIKVTDIDQAAKVVGQSVALLDRQYIGLEHAGEDWSQSESSLFSALKMEKIMTWFMLMMIVAIGAFNIISTLIMVVADKQADIAILRTMGASEKTIMAIFMVQGTVVGIVGTLLGAGLGLLLSQQLHRITGLIESLLAPHNVYMVASLPTQIRYQDVWLTCCCALLISFLATLYPAWKASRILPAEVLRYE